MKRGEFHKLVKKDNQDAWDRYDRAKKRDGDSCPSPGTRDAQADLIGTSLTHWERFAEYCENGGGTGGSQINLPFGLPSIGVRDVIRTLILIVLLLLLVPAERRAGIIHHAISAIAGGGDRPRPALVHTNRVAIADQPEEPLP